MKLKNYISGHWIEGSGNEMPLYNAVNGDLVAISDTGGIDFEQALHYGRTVGYKNLSSMTFYDRGEMLKKVALYLLERKKNITIYPIKPAQLTQILGSILKEVLEHSSPIQV